MAFRVPTNEEKERLAEMQLKVFITGKPSTKEDMEYIRSGGKFIEYALITNSNWNKEVIKGLPRE